MGNYIKEAKCMFAMDWIATFDFEANELDSHQTVFQQPL
jgi:hypothetical protein